MFSMEFVNNLIGPGGRGSSLVAHLNSVSVFSRSRNL
jgi:hypothetical protein